MKDQVKIIDLLNEKIEKDEKFFAFEFFPAKDDDSMGPLVSKIQRMNQIHPLFSGITWGTGNSCPERSMALSSALLQSENLCIMQNLTCGNMKTEEVKLYLEQIKQSGIRNILALRGDYHPNADWSTPNNEMNHAVSLVRLIRELYGDYFCIAVAGYPEGHQECTSRHQDILYLKEKVEEGADFILTQFFYEFDVFQQFVEECHSVGIHCPIIPGFMPIQTYRSFNRVLSYCSISAPQDLVESLGKYKNNDEECKRYGAQYLDQLIQRCFDIGTPGIYIYTLNLEKTVYNILKPLNSFSIPLKSSAVFRSQSVPVLKNLVTSSMVSPPRRLPKDEQKVLSIHYANRPKEFCSVIQSMESEENTLSTRDTHELIGTQFSQITLHGGQLLKDPLLLRSIWSNEIHDINDIIVVFINFLRGKIPSLPWCIFPLDSESQYIYPYLMILNTEGYLTINSQPQLNGVSSSDSNLNWGRKGGYVYQKAYLECFLSPEKLATFIHNCEKYPSISYFAVNNKNDVYTNRTKSTNITISWSVFPDSTIYSSTVVNQEDFLLWKQEAFALWNSWKSIYPKEDTQSRRVIEDVQNNWYLMNVIENDYIHGDISRPFDLHI